MTLQTSILNITIQSNHLPRTRNNVDTHLCHALMQDALELLRQIVKEIKKYEQGYVTNWPVFLIISTEASASIF